MVGIRQVARTGKEEVKSQVVFHRVVFQVSVLYMVCCMQIYIAQNHHVLKSRGVRCRRVRLLLEALFLLGTWESGTE